MTASTGLTPPRRNDQAWLKLRVTAFAVISVAAAFFAAGHLRVDANTDALLPADLPWRHDADLLKQAFPALSRNFVLIVSSEVPELAEQTASALAQTLQRQTNILADVNSVATSAFMRRHALLYLDAQAFREHTDRIEAAQPMLGQLAQSPDLAGLFDMLDSAYRLDKAVAGGERQALTRALARQLHEQHSGTFGTLSWRRLMDKQLRSDSLLLSMRAVDIDAEAAAYAAIRDAVKQHSNARVRVQVTGEVPLWLDELAAANRGGIVTGIVSLLLVLGMLWYFLSSGRWVTIGVLTLLSGLCLTAGYAALVVGRLNLISVAFAALFIGLAIDFTLHWIYAYRDARTTSNDSRIAAQQTTRDTGKALALCALTTALAFLAFVPTDYQGVAELGHISAAGIVLGLLCALLLLPSLVQLNEPATAVPRRSATGRWTNRVWRRPVPPLLILLALLLWSAYGLTALRFDMDPTRLKPETPALQAYRELLAGDSSPMQARVLAASETELRALSSRLTQLPEVLGTRSALDLIPEGQSEKLARLEELQWTVGDTLPAKLMLRPPELETTRSAAASLLQALSDRQPQDPEAAALEAALAPWLQSLSADNLLTRQHGLMATLPALYASISELLQASEIELDTLPPALREAWISNQGLWLLQVSARGNLDDDRQLQDFVTAVHKVAPQASGPPVEYREGARTVVAAFVEAFVMALLAIVLVLVLTLRNLADVLTALAPLLLGSAIYLALTTALQLPLNFANVIALPLLFGLAVDTGIHLIWQHRKRPGHNPVDSATGRAVNASLGTTLASFIALTLSPHPGMASMGLHLAIGLMTLLGCTLLCIPALLSLRQGARDHDAV